MYKIGVLLTTWMTCKLTITHLQLVYIEVIKNSALRKQNMLIITSDCSSLMKPNHYVYWTVRSRCGNTELHDSITADDPAQHSDASRVPVPDDSAGSITRKKSQHSDDLTCFSPKTDDNKVMKCLHI